MKLLDKLASKIEFNDALYIFQIVLGAGVGVVIGILIGLDIIG